MDEGENVYEVSKPDYQDIRDDRVYTYFGLTRNRSYYNTNSYTKTFVILLNAAYVGDYFLAPVRVEDMYDNEIYARNTGFWVKVVKQGEGK